MCTKVCFGRGACQRRVGGCDIHAAFDSPTGLIYPAYDTGNLVVRTNSTVYEIEVDPATAATSKTGVFGVGDVVTYPGKLKLILTGFAEAAIAARSAYALIHPETPLHFEYSTTSGVPDA